MSVPIPPPPLPPPSPPAPPKKNTLRLVLIIAAVLVVASVASSLLGGNGGGCVPASAAALDTIASGARHKYEPLALLNGQATGATITFATGDQLDGKLVAATTPAGTGVWVMDLDAYSSDSGLVFAANDIAKSTTIWGSQTNFDPVDSSDVTAVAACVGSSP